MLSLYRHLLAWLFMLFFFSASFHIQAAEPIASDKENDSEKNPYQSCSQQSSFTKEKFPTLALRVADKLKYSRENIHVAICKVWPGHSGKSLVALVRRRDENLSGQDIDMFDLDVLVVKSQSGDILQHLSQKKAITSDAERLDGITFDTANYHLASKVRAFGLLIRHSHSGAISSESEMLNLYAPQKNQLKPILLGLTISSSIWNRGVCVDDVLSTQRTLALGNTSHHGYMDLVLIAKNTASKSEEKKIDGYCPEKQWSNNYILQYDGVKYVVPKEIR